MAFAAAALAAGLAVASPGLAQGLGRGMPAPASMFKKSKDNRDVTGLSLAATDEPVIDVRVIGNKLVPTAQILNELQTRVGRPYDPALMRHDVRKLANRSWFVAVEPEIERTAEGYIVTLKVAERPTIRYIEYLGNRRIRDKKLAKETGLKVGGSVDPYMVEEARRKIIDLYRRNGHNETQVSILEGNKATDQGVVLVINEGTPQRIWKVKFIGADFVTGRRLKTQIESKPPMLYVFKGYVDREQIDADVDRLTAYYRSYGFFQAKVGRKIEYNEKGNWATLVFVVNEGPRYEVRNVRHMGNQVFADTSLDMGMNLPPGSMFEQAKMNKDVHWLKEVYGSQGYVFADVQAEPVFLEERGKIDLIYHIEEGKQWRVGRIFVHIDGDNPHTRIQTALNRLSFQPGQIVDIREIHASERRLQASSLFLSDPARGVTPKITYRIRELDEQLASEPGGSNVRGQSPDGADAPARLPSAASSKMYEVPLPAGYAPSDDAMDVHLYYDDRLPEQAPPAPPAAPTVAPDAGDQSAAPASHSVYQKLVVRTQSPYQASTTQPYPTSTPYPQYAAVQAAGAGPSAGYPAATAPNPYAVAQSGNPPVSTTQNTYPQPQAAVTNDPRAAYTNNPYGGLAVGATGPESTPVGYNAQAVQPAQYTETLPPAGAFGPPTLPPPQQQYPPQPQGVPTYGQPAVVVPNQQITPIPPNPVLFPSGQVEPWARPFEDPSVDIFVDANETQTGRLMLGVAVNSDAGLFGQILLDEQNFNWKRWPTNMEDVVSGRAWRGAGQRFRLEAMPGTQVQRYIASFQEPYLWDTPLSFGLSGSYYDRRFEDWSEQRLGGRVSFGWNWTADDVSAALSYRGENVKLYDPVTVGVPELDEAVGNNALHGFKFTLANDTRDSAFFATSGHYFELGLEQVVGSFVYPRATLDMRQYGLITERPDHSGRHVLSFITQLGFTGSDTPIYDQFYSGGIEFPGFEFHSITPVMMGVQTGGDFMWVNALEYLFPLTADDMVHGVAFVGFGTVEENITIDWGRFRVAPGFGLRLTIPAMGPAPIALNFAFPVADARTDQEQVFSFNIGFNR